MFTEIHSPRTTAAARREELLVLTNVFALGISLLRLSIQSRLLGFLDSSFVRLLRCNG
jgi:hypothetical protein